MPLTSAVASASVSVPFAHAFGYTFTVGHSSPSAAFSPGTTAGKVDLIYSSKASVSTTPVDLDLAGSLLQPDGTAAAFHDVSFVMVENLHATATITIGGGSNPLVGVAGVVRPGGVAMFLAKASPYPVTAGTGDLLRLTASAGTAEYKITILGRSAST